MVIIFHDTSSHMNGLFPLYEDQCLAFPDDQGLAYLALVQPALLSWILDVGCGMLISKFFKKISKFKFHL